LDFSPAQKKIRISDHDELCSQQEQIQNFIRMFLSCTLPISIVKNNELKQQFCSSLNSGFKVPNTDVLKNSIITTYDRIVNLIKDKIAKTSEYMALTLNRTYHCLRVVKRIKRDSKRDQIPALGVTIVIEKLKQRLRINQPKNDVIWQVKDTISDNLEKLPYISK
ncbi:13566_t:CDS:2, partial [Cetraspora pellucida]